MAYAVEFLKTAEQELARLPKDAQRQIVKRVEGLKGNPRPPGVEPLKGAEKLLRLRVGDYRVVYTVESRHLVVLVVRIGHRKEVYENLAGRLSPYAGRVPERTGQGPGPP